jgi:hypothetical protein
LKNGRLLLEKDVVVERKEKQEEGKDQQGRLEVPFILSPTSHA